MADELLPGGEVPEGDAICHDSKQNDEEEGEEGRGVEDVEG